MDGQSVFFTAVNPMYDDQSMEEILCDLEKPRIAPYKYLETSSTHSVLVQLKTRSEEMIAILPNTITRDRSLTRTEKAVCMKTKEELYQKVYRSPRLPRVVLEANSQSGQLDQQEQDARTSCNHPSASQSFRESWCNNVDYRIPGILLSTVEQQDTNRQNKVKKS